MKIIQKQIEEAITEISSKEGFKVYKLLKGKENVNEFLIAEKLKITINQIRNIIYKFEKYDLVSSTRKKDRKKGWYIYFFTPNKKQIEELVINLKKDRIKIFKERLDRELNHEYYSCPNKCIRMTLENAMENNFMCHECGSLLGPENKEKNIKRIKKEIKIIDDELKKIGV